MLVRQCPLVLTWTRGGECFPYVCNYRFANRVFSLENLSLPLWAEDCEMSGVTVAFAVLKCTEIALARSTELLTTDRF